MVCESGSPSRIADLSNANYSYSNDLLKPMTTAFNSYSSELVSTPGPAFIDSSASLISGFSTVSTPSVYYPRDAGRTNDSLEGDNENESFVETRPPPLTPMDGEPVMKRASAKRPMSLPQMQDQRFKRSMAVVRSEFPHIHDTIATMWGNRHCSKYIHTLLLNGDSGADKKNTLTGLKVGVVSALMVLYELHDNTQPDTLH